ncbi:MAG: hypothetical protein AB1297_08975, partial [bacterium]
EIYDTFGYWANLCNFLSGKPVLSIEESAYKLYLSPIHNAFDEVLKSPEKNMDFLSTIRAFSKMDFSIEEINDKFKRNLELIFELNSERENLLLLWNLLYEISLIGKDFIDEWQLWRVIRENIEDKNQAWRKEFLLKILLLYPDLSDVAELLKDELVKSYIHLNEYQGITYFHKESFEELIDCLFLVSSILYPEKAKEKEALTKTLIQLADASKYQLERMLQ